jgi:hypothetical protein
MIRTGRRAALAAVLVAVLGACTLRFGDSVPPSDPSVPPGGGPPPTEVPTGPGSAAAAARALCVPPEPFSTGEGGPPGPTPPAIAEVEDQVQQVRDLAFLRDVDAEPVSEERIDRDLAAAFDATYPRRLYDRRTLAWRTIGAIPPDADLRSSLAAFQQGQVVGFYNPTDGQLVYLGDDAAGGLDTTERVILAHELTHAIDDQHFDLGRLDAIAARCRDEALQAALGAVEGSAQFFAFEVLRTFPPEPGDDPGTGGSGLPDAPAFVTALQLWPYEEGLRFVSDLEARGGTALVDRALRQLPVSTEQILHPGRWPADRPTPVDVADLAPALGPGWRDLDVMVVGEAWLQELLDLRLDPSSAERAAAGWDGGLYRAWTDGEDVGVVLRTVWDSEEDAQTFSTQLEAWTDVADATFVFGPRGPVVDAVFATSGTVLETLRSQVEG